MITKNSCQLSHEFTSLLILACLSTIAMAHDANASDDLWGELQAGGKVVLMRHAPVQPGPESGDPLLRDPSCKNERNLSNRGKRSAEEVGGRFREHGIPVSKVLHSPYCRTTETARIAFGAASPAEYLSLLEILSPDQAAQQTEELNRIIGAYTGDANLILVTHEPNIRAVSFELMKHLDILVIEPEGEEEFEELGVIKFSNSQ